MAHAFRMGLVAAILVAFVADPLAAQVPSDGQRPTVVSGTGMVKLERPPTTLVMSLQLLGKGKDVKDALSKLKDRREAALLLLESLEADMDSVKFGEPSTSNSASAQRSQFERMVRERVMSSGRDTPKGLKLPSVVTVSTTLTARWPLKGETTDERLIENERLVKEIKAADLAGAKDSQEASPEEQELMEEMAAAMGGGRFGGGDEELPPGTPFFGYAASITQAERDAALADAFQKAKEEAARLAAAAGAELGPLVQLSQIGNSVNDSPYDMYEYGYGMPGPQRMMMQMMVAAAQDGEGERYSQQFGPVKFGVAVEAGFYLKPGG